ncbi:alkaline phosphatase family protein [Comamonas terrigena]|uniref:alkaline phosphatase family protein n=1 Tax=Comamonas terrigena TaxID=32013 RepID=UPI0024499549|nr:alkaline phosphatase family protein [Comamonas terrigena]MDH1500351.1 alkaline phosphatase family protein [Comamonas terrigena]
MNEKNLLLGPVLSFRGIGKGDYWRVTALIGLKAGAEIPEFQVDGKTCPAPKELLSMRGERYLRYDISCKVLKVERTVSYGIPGGLSWNMTVPGKDFSPRMAYVSCNGFSDPAVMRKIIRTSDAVWEDLLYSHDRKLRKKPGEGDGKLLDKEQLWHEKRIHDKGLQRFHLMLMGGDQIYFDSIWEDISVLRQWVALPRQAQLNFKVSKSLDREIEAYYFGLYKQRWLPTERLPWSSAVAALDAGAAMASMPTIMMWDDHDIFDGWGSYSCEMQNCELFQTLFRHARRAFWVFQMQHALEDLPELEDITPPGFTQQDPLLKPMPWKRLLAEDSLALPLLDKQPGFTSAYSIGQVSVVAADLRTERSRTQIMGSDTWKQIKEWTDNLQTGGAGPQPKIGCQHLLFMSSVPVVHPKLPLAELFLDKFGQDHVTDSNADDLKDHWSHDDHEGERKRLLEVLSGFARDKKIRVSLVSGDVHVAAWGTAYRKDLPASETWSQMHQFTSSAVVHPSLMGVTERLFLAWLNSNAKKPQNIDVQYVAEIMNFPGHDTNIMAARNWLALELDLGSAEGCKLWATWRCETETSFSNHLVAVAPVV